MDLGVRGSQIISEKLPIFGTEWSAAVTGVKGELLGELLLLLGQLGQQLAQLAHVGKVKILFVRALPTPAPQSLPFQ